MDLVRLSGDRLIVSSLDISNHFGKRHDDVLKAVRNLDCSPEFRRRNFAESSYTNSQNRKMPMSEITRDGFVFLCMGFTGQQAAVWKERYIDAFNQMEAALRGRSVPAKADPAALQLATELGLLRDELRLQSATMLGLYRELDSARRGHIRALTKLTSERQRHAAADAKATVLRMLREGYPRETIAAATGKALNHIRQIAFKARAEGLLPPIPHDTTGDLFAEGGAA